MPLNEYIGGHHEKTIASYLKAAEYCVKTFTSHRCPQCWLIRNHCFCSKLFARHSFYENEGLIFNNVKVTIYYHFKEVGRSANTAHILPLLLPRYCDTLLFGDVVAEEAFFSKIRSELNAGVNTTCFLYPTADAPFISDWMLSARARRSVDTDSEGYTAAAAVANDTDRKIANIVILDGTYSQAARCKHTRMVHCIHGDLMYDHHVSTQAAEAHREAVGASPGASGEAAAGGGRVSVRGGRNHAHPVCRENMFVPGRLCMYVCMYVCMYAS